MATPTAAVAAVNALRRSESNALNGTPSYYTGSGRDQDSTSNGKVKGKKKGKAALFTILLILFGGGAFLGSSNSLLAPAIEALFTEGTDTQYISARLRFPVLMKSSKMSSSFEKRLAKQGITIEGSGSSRIFKFTQTIDDVDVVRTFSADEFVAAVRTDTDVSDAVRTAQYGRVGTFFDKIADKIYTKLGISRNLFNQYKQTGDSDVDVAEYRNTMTEKFDGNTSEIRSASQNVEQATERVEAKYDENGKKIGEEVVGYDWSTKPDGSTIGTATSSDVDVDSATVKAQSLVSSISSKLTQAGSAACTLMQVGNMISIMVAANEIYQSINYFLGLTENFSKMKAGYGDESATNEVLNFLSTPTHTTTDNFGNLTTDSDASVSIDVPPEHTGIFATITNKLAAFFGFTKTKDTISDSAPVFTVSDYDQTGTPLEANGVQMLLAYAPAVATTGGLFSLERISGSMMSKLTTGSGTTYTCSAINAATALVSIGMSFATLGTFKLVSAIVSTGASYVISAGVGVLLQFLIPTIAKSLFTNAFEVATGIPAGELFAKGASAANTRLGRNGSGQSLSSATAVNAYLHATDTVLAMDAAIDQKNLSPFDTTNKNTFFGSIAYSLLPLTTTSGMTTLSTFLRTTSRSLATLTGKASADSGTSGSFFAEESHGDCPTLGSIGAVGDIYCNPITTTDLSTIELSPDDATYQQVLHSAGSDNIVVNLDSDDQVNKGSNLARYITYCANRDSPFGNTDQNIINDLQVSAATGPLSSLLNAAPFIGDVLQLADAIADVKNLPWANGERCGNTEQNSEFWNSEGKYYQRYIEDNRLLEQMGAFEADANDGTALVNPVTAYEEAYEAEHPVDDSYEGYLSRISGLTQDNVETVLAFVEYYYFLDQYDPTSRIAMTDDLLNEQSGAQVAAHIESERLVFTDGSPVEQPSLTFIAYQRATYADLRGRTYTV